MGTAQNYFNQESKRLVYRKLTLEDIPSWEPFFINNDRLAYMGIQLDLNFKTQARNWVEKQLKRYESPFQGHLAVIEKASNTFIGMAGLFPREIKEQKDDSLNLAFHKDTSRKEYEVAYSLLPKYWGKGFGTEMAQQIKSFGIANQVAKRYVSIIHKENTASMNVAKKNGMEVLYEAVFEGMPVFVYGIEV